MGWGEGAVSRGNVFLWLYEIIKGQASEGCEFNVLEMIWRAQ